MKYLFTGHANGITEEKLSKLEKLSSAFKVFCIDNAQNIVSCKCINSPYCMRNCKFYHQEIYSQCGTENDSYLERK
jgi:hypothetical protein